jgi:tRNA(Ile)-lysidine synthase
VIKLNKKNSLILKFIKNLNFDFPFLKNTNEKIKILVAVSGGSDSICLLKLLHTINNQTFCKNNMSFNFEIFPVHINHQLRGAESDDDEKFVKNFCDNLGIKLIVKNLNFENKSSLEEKARNARYEIFHEICKKHKINFCFLAHNYDDDAETILMRIIRGTGINGLSGIPKIRILEKNNSLSENNIFSKKLMTDKLNLKKIYILRPLLDFPKKEIENFLKNENIDFRFDSSNNENIYTRNKIRNSLFPLLQEYNKNIKQNLLNLKKIIQEEQSYLIQNFLKNNKNILNLEKYNDETALILDVEKFIKINKNFISSALSYILKDKANFNHIEKIKNLLITENKNFSLNIKNGFIIKNYSNKIYLTKKNLKDNINIKQNFSLKILNEALKNNKKIDCEIFSFDFEIFDANEKILSELDLKNKACAYFDYDNIIKIYNDITNLTFRNRLSGDIFYPFGMKSYKKLKEYFIDSGIKKENRSKTILLTNKNDILWVIGDRISENLKITKTTKKILKFTIIFK